MMSWYRYTGHSGRFSNGERPAVLYLSLFATLVQMGTLLK